MIYGYKMKSGLTYKDIFFLIYTIYYLKLLYNLLSVYFIETKFGYFMYSYYDKMPVLKIKNIGSQNQNTT